MGKRFLAALDRLVRIAEMPKVSAEHGASSGRWVMSVEVGQ